MIRNLIAISLMAALALAMPGSSPTASAADGGKIKIATLSPRGSAMDTAFKKLNAKLGQATNGAWGIKYFPSGVAGDEKDVLRKMNVGQMDSTIITTTGLSQIVREIAVLDAPGVVKGYAELDRIKKAMWPEFQKSFADKGIRLLGWGEAGQYRYFSKKPITKMSDLKQMRPWVWPSSYVLKEVLSVLGATGVPLGVPEVYGALQTNMIDAAVSTSVAAAGLQWWSKVSHITADTQGVLLMGVVMTDKRWQQLPPEVQKIMSEEISDLTEQNIKTIRKDDLKTYKKLTKRGLKEVKWNASALKEFDDMAAKVRSRLAGRVYPQAMLDRVMKIGSGK